MMKCNSSNSGGTPTLTVANGNEVLEQVELVVHSYTQLVQLITRIRFTATNLTVAVMTY